MHVKNTVLNYTVNLDLNFSRFPRYNVLYYAQHRHTMFWLSKLDLHLTLIERGKEGGIESGSSLILFNLVKILSFGDLDDLRSDSQVQLLMVDRKSRHVMTNIHRYNNNIDTLK